MTTSSRALIAALATTAALAVAPLGAADAAPAARPAFTVGIAGDVHQRPVAVGGRAYLFGKVTPAAVGARVRVQVRYEDTARWRTIATPRLGPLSRYRFVDPITTDRDRDYRVVKPGAGRRGPGVSRVVHVPVVAARRG